MRALASWLALAAALAGAGCNALVGNSDHQLAPPPDAAPVTDASAADAPASDAAPDAPQEGSTGGTVPPTSGGIYSVGRVPDDASAAVLPSGATVTITDDGFEFGETLCNGTTCVTGAIAP